MASTNDSASRRFGGSRGLALALAFQLLHTRLSGANPLTERFDLEPRPHLVLPRTLECLEKPVASRCVKNGTRRLQGMLQLRLSRRCGCRSIIPGSLRLRESCLKPFTLRAGSLDLHGGAVDLFYRGPA